MEKEQIVKALECLHKRILNTDLAEKVTESEMMAIINALSLIRELTEENTRLRAEKETLETIEKDLRFRNKEFQKANEGLAKNCEEFEIELDGIKADTVRKMQKRLRQCFDNTADRMAVYPEGQVLFAIDQIAKEILAMENDSQSVSQSNDTVKQIFAEIEKFEKRPIPEAKPVYILKQCDLDEIRNKYIPRGTPPDTCVECGEIIPEGRQVCPSCISKTNKKTKKARKESEKRAEN